MLIPMRRLLRFGFALVLMVAAFVSLLLFYLPEHLMRQVTEMVTVTVDGRHVQATAYLGQPTTNEADAFLLVIIPGEGNFLINFDDENFRQVPSREFFRLYRGAVIIKPMTNGLWSPLLPFLHTDEIRVASSKGHTITVILHS